MVANIRPQRIDALDAVRALAVAMVFLHHLSGYTFGRFFVAWDGWVLDTADRLLILYPFTVGWLGVAVFFALSGFCIHRAFEKSGANVGEYFTRRFFRIYPPYAVALVLFASLLHPDTPNLLLHATLTHNFSREYLFGINPSFWTIAIEAQLYVIYPLIWVAAQRFGWLTALLATLAIETIFRTALTLSALGYAMPPLLTLHSPAMYIFSWTVGAYFAAVPEARKVPAWVAGTALAAAFLAPISLVTYRASFPLAAFGTAVIIARLVARRPAEATWKRPIYFVGLISYSFYLFHQPIVEAAVSLARSVSTWNSIGIFVGAGAAAFAGATVVAALSFYAIERPSLDIGKRISARLAA